MEKQVLFFDFDGFMFDTNPAVLDYIEHRYGVSLPRDVFHCGNSLDQVVSNKLPEGESVSREEFYDDYGVNFLPSLEWHSNVLPIENMAPVVKELRRKYTIYIVTARQSQGSEVLSALLEEHVPDCIAGIHCVWNKTAPMQFEERSKRSFIESNSSGQKKAYFDDHPDEIRGVRDILPSYLFDPIGHHNDEKDIEQRVRSWSEIGELLLK